MQEMQPFQHEISLVNLRRAWLFMIALLLLHLAIMVPDILRLVSGELRHNRGYDLLFRMHLVMEGGLLAMLPFIRKALSANGDGSQLRSSPLPLILAFFLLLSAAIISGVDQLIHGEVTVYIIAVFGIAVSIFLPFRAAALLFCTGLVVFLTSVTLLQPDRDELIAHIINGTLVSVLALLLSKNLYESRRKEFLVRLELDRQKENLERQTKEDGLTGVYNRRHLTACLAGEFSRTVRHSRPLSIAILDIDSFKRINDELSHQTGDNVLVQIAEILTESARAEDTVFRYGGDEFVILFPETRPRDAEIVCRRIWESVRTRPWKNLGTSFPVTVSCGVAGFDPDDAETVCDSADDLLKEADRKLYESKYQGRDRVTL